jgi:23S rRNA (adenine2503-C2)-methyltransferase
VIETVLMGYRDRVTVCISTQSGCAMGCGFCATGQMGLRSNLTAGEIAAQVVWGRREAATLPDPTPRRLTNVVFMGMGEPIGGYLLPRSTYTCHRILDQDLGEVAK